MKRQIYFSGECEPCGGGGSDARNEFVKKIKSNTPGPAGKSVQGAPGKDNIVQGSQINLSGVDVDGNDEALGGGTIAALKADGFDLNAKETIKATLDESDIAHTKWFVRQSNAKLNYEATIPPRLFKAGGTAGQIPKKIDNTDYNWAWVDPSSVIGNPYKTTSNTDTETIAIGSITLQVAVGLQYTKYVIVAAVDSNNDSNYVLGILTSYNPATGAMIIDVKSVSGSGTPTGWNVNIGHTPFLPDMAGNSGYVLTNNGLSAFWSQSVTIPVGTAVDYYGTIAPDGWAFADGSTQIYDPALPKSPSNPYKDLVIVMGANSNTSPFYGGSPTTFKLPNRKRRVSVGFDSDLTGTVTGAYDKVGLTGGIESANITLAELPQHTHDSPAATPFVVHDGVNVSPTDEGDNTGNNLRPRDATGGITGFTAQSKLSRMQPYEVCNVIVKL